MSDNDVVAVPVPAVRLVLTASRVAGATGVASLLLAGVTVVTARSLGPSGRGALVLVSTVSTYVMLVISLGIPIPARVMMAGRNRRVVVKNYLGLGLVLFAIQVLVSTVLIRLALTRSGISVTPPEDGLASVYSGALMGAFLLTHALYGVGFNHHAAFLQVWGAIAQLVLVVGLAMLHVGSVWPYIGAMLGGASCQIVISLVVLERRLLSIWPTFSLGVWRALIVRGIPAIGLTLGQAAVLRFDRILVGLYLAASAVGIYSVAATATEIVWLLPVGLSQVLFHAFASKSVDVSAITRARLASLAFAVLTALAIYAIAPLAINRLVGAQFADAVAPLRVLLIGAILLSSYQLDAYALAARGRLGRAAAATIGGFSAMFLIDLVLIPMYGIVGAAWASVIAYGVMALAVRIMVTQIRTQPELTTVTPER